jgi:aspartate kinase
VREAADLGKVSVIGAGIRSHPGIAARTFSTLEAHGVGLRMISTSPIKVSCLVDRGDVERGVRALHEAFSLSAAAAAHPEEG